MSQHREIVRPSGRSERTLNGNKASIMRKRVFGLEHGEGEQKIEFARPLGDVALSDEVVEFGWKGLEGANIVEARTVWPAAEARPLAGKQRDVTECTPSVPVQLDRL